MAYASRLYPRAKPRGFTLQWINILKSLIHMNKRLFIWLKNQHKMTGFTKNTYYLRDLTSRNLNTAE